MANFRRYRPQKVFSKRGLILCEGETEENYFKGFVTKDSNKRKFSAISVEIYKPKDHSPKGLVSEAKNRIKQAIKEKSPYDFVWVVFDRDGHQNIQAAFHEARTFKYSIKIGFTITCFEYFVLLHFIKSTKAYPDCDGVVKELKKYIPEYEKASNLYKTLEPYKDIGFENSKWALAQNQNDLDLGVQIYELSSYSNIHELMIFLEEEI